MGVMSVSSVFTPFTYIGLSQAGMVGPAGRVLFADKGANGMSRGEGCGGLFLEVSNDNKVVQNRMGSYVSSFINQDGRSASLTAPNGPSQQMCMRKSLETETLLAADLCYMEC